MKIQFLCGEKNDTNKSIFVEESNRNAGNVKSLTSKWDLTNPGVLYVSSVQVVFVAWRTMEEQKSMKKAFASQMQWDKMPQWKIAGAYKVFLYIERDIDIKLCKKIWLWSFTSNI